MVVIILVVLVFAIVVCVDGSQVRQTQFDMDSTIRFVEIEKILTLQSQQIMDLTKTVHEQNMEINNLKQKLEKLENNVDERSLLGNNERDLINQRIGFYAYLSHKELIGEHKIMVFNIAKTNMGNGYSTNSGVFTAPIVGLYGFSFALFPSRSSAGSLHILVNDKVLGVIFTDSDSDNWDISSSSMTSVAMLKQGDEVFIRSNAGYKNSGTIESSDYTKSSFAGWLISP